MIETEYKPLVPLLKAKYLDELGAVYAYISRKWKIVYASCLTGD